MYRIGIDARMYRPGATGIGRYIFELTQALFEIDKENEYILFFNEEAYHSYTCPNHRISKRRTKAKYYSLGEQTVFLQDLVRENLDLVHFTHFNAPILYNNPSVVTIHDLTLSKFPGQKMNTMIHKMAYNYTIKNITQKAKQIIAVSKHTAKDLKEMLNVPKEKISVVYEGISKEFENIEDIKELKKVKTKYRITKPYFLYIGVWRNHKNLVNLVKGFKILREKYKTDAQLVLTGREDNKHYPEVRNTINAHQLSNEIITPGFIPEEDIVALYNAAEALVNPSLYEGFGFPPLEAMACLTPAVVSNASCHKEIYKDNALYFKPDDTNDIAEKLNKIITDQKERERLIKSGIKYVKDFNWEKTAKETLGIYLKVIQSKKKQANKKTLKIKKIDKKNKFNAKDSLGWVFSGIKKTAKDLGIDSPKKIMEKVKDTGKNLTDSLPVDIGKGETVKKGHNAKEEDNKVEDPKKMNGENKIKRKKMGKLKSIKKITLSPKKETHKSSKAKTLKKDALESADNLEKKSKELEKKAKKTESNVTTQDITNEKKEEKIANQDALVKAAKQLQEAANMLRITSKQLSENITENYSDNSEKKSLGFFENSIKTLKNKGEEIFNEHIKEKIEEVGDKLGEMSIDRKNQK